MYIIKQFFNTLIFIFLAFNCLAADLKPYENYLNNITSFVADFTEVGEEGNVRTGIFYLSRPGRFRWQYHPPTPFLIVANGSLLTYHDMELNQKTYLSLNNNLAGFLIKKHISFTDGVKIVGSKQGAGLTHITIVAENKPTAEKITLVFSDKPILLKQLEVFDANQHLTVVNFYNIRDNMLLDKSLFIIKNVEKKL
jgi:outer membrane lipoprotein carrier protein